MNTSKIMLDQTKVNPKCQMAEEDLYVAGVPMKPWAQMYFPNHSSWVIPQFILELNFFY